MTALHGFCFYTFVAVSLDATTSRKFVLLGWRPCRPDVAERFSVLAPSKPQYYNEHRCHCGSKGSVNITFAIIGAVLYAQLKGCRFGSSARTYIVLILSRCRKQDCYSYYKNCSTARFIGVNFFSEVDLCSR